MLISQNFSPTTHTPVPRLQFLLHTPNTFNNNICSANFLCCFRDGKVNEKKNKIKLKVRIEFFENRNLPFPSEFDVVFDPCPFIFIINEIPESHSNRILPKLLIQ